MRKCNTVILPEIIIFRLFFCKQPWRFDFYLELANFPNSISAITATRNRCAYRLLINSIKSHTYTQIITIYAHTHTYKSNNALFLIRGHAYPEGYWHINRSSKQNNRKTSAIHTNNLQLYLLLQILHIVCASQQFQTQKLKRFCRTKNRKRRLDDEQSGFPLVFSCKTAGLLVRLVGECFCFFLSFYYLSLSVVSPASPVVAGAPSSCRSSRMKLMMGRKRERRESPKGNKYEAMSWFVLLIYRLVIMASQILIYVARFVERYALNLMLISLLFSNETNACSEKQKYAFQIVISAIT